MNFDFAVIGGGIAGASAAYELAGLGSVVLLEQEATCGQHSTGRSAALFTECYGESVVRRLAIASRSFLTNPPNGFADHQLLQPRGLLFVGRDDQAEALDQAAEMFREFVPAARRVGRAEAIELCPVLRRDSVAGGVYEPDAMDIDVHELHQSFLRGVTRRGGAVRTNAEVTRLTSAGGAWHLEAGGGRLAAQVVVNAAGAWSDHVAALAGIAPLGLVPNRRTAFTFRPPEGVDHGSWPMIVDVDEEFYFKPEGIHVLGSPAEETPMEPCDVRHQEIDVAIGIDRIQSATTMIITHVHRAWAGLRTFVADHRPVVGMDPDHAGFFWLSGQGGFGIKTSPAIGRAAAGLIADNVLPEDLTDLGITPVDLTPQRLRRGDG